MRHANLYFCSRIYDDVNLTVKWSKHSDHMSELVEHINIDNDEIYSTAKETRKLVTFQLFENKIC